MTDQNQIISQYFASLGRKGGKAFGRVKVRGDSEYYRRLSAKGVKARKIKSKALKKTKKNSNSVPDIGDDAGQQ